MCNVLFDATLKNFKFKYFYEYILVFFFNFLNIFKAIIKKSTDINIRNEI